MSCYGGVSASLREGREESCQLIPLTLNLYPDAHTFNNSIYHCPIAHYPELSPSISLDQMSFFSKLTKEVEGLFEDKKKDTPPQAQAQASPQPPPPQDQNRGSK